MKPLPSSFAVRCTDHDCWFAVSRADRPHDRTFDHQRLNVNEAGAFVIVAENIPLVPEPPRRRRTLPRFR